MSPLLLPLHLTLLLSGAAATLIAAVLAWPHRRASAGPVLLGLLLAVAEWQVTSAFGVSATTLAGKRLWAQVQYVGIAAVPPLWLQFVLRYQGDVRASGRALFLATTLPPLALVIAAATSAHHALLWTEISLVPLADGVRATFHHGPLFWAGSAYNYLLLAWATVLLLRRASLTGDAMHAQRRTLLVGGVVPWVANALYLSGVGARWGLDLTPIAFGITGICAVIALADLGLMSLSPALLWRGVRR